MTGADRVPVLWPLVIAAVVSAVASYYLLRARAPGSPPASTPGATGITRRFEESRSKEDQD